MDIKGLEEFQYVLGDCRPHFINYITTRYVRIKSYITLPTKRLTNNMLFQFTCNTEKQKRMIVPPEKINLENFYKKKEDKEEAFLLIPVMMKNKLNCKRKNASKHLIFLLYNKFTHELERIDIRRYHTDGFSLKLFVSHLKNSFTKTYFNSDASLKIIEDIDVPDVFVKSINKTSPREAYPIFLLCYLDMRNRYPKMDSRRVIEKVCSVTTIEKAQKLWDDYVKYRANLPAPCKTGFVLNPETMRCLQPLSSTLQDNLIVAVPKDCTKTQEYNTLQRKCVRKGAKVNINILLNEALSSNHSITETLQHVDSGKNVVFATMQFLMSKHPHAFWLYPRDVSVDALRIRDTRIIWKAKDSKVLLPKHFWNTWKYALNDPSIKFIVVPIHLSSAEDGKHANVLIFDKSTQELERFDSLGKDLADHYYIEVFDNMIEELFKEQGYNIKYFKPMDYCPAKMPIFQSKELNELPGVDLRGNCAVWRLWYIDVRLGNPHLDRKTLIEVASNALRLQVGNLHRFIKMYQKYILDSSNLGTK